MEDVNGYTYIHTQRTQTSRFVYSRDGSRERSWLPLSPLLLVGPAAGPLRPARPRPPPLRLRASPYGAPPVSQQREQASSRTLRSPPLPKARGGPPPAQQRRVHERSDAVGCLEASPRPRLVLASRWVQMRDLPAAFSKEPHHASNLLASMRTVQTDVDAACYPRQHRDRALVQQRVLVVLHVDVEHVDRARDRVHLKKRVEPGRPGCQRASLGAMHHAVTP